MSTRGKLCLLLTLVACRASISADFVMAGFGPQRNSATAERVAPPLALVWRFATTEDPGVTAVPVVAGNQVYFCATGILYCLDAETGEIHWQYDTKFDIRQTPVLHNGRVYLGNDDGSLFVLDAAVEPAGERLIGVVQIGAPLRCDPVVIDEIMYLVDDGGRLHAIKLDDLSITELIAFRSPPKGNLAWDGETSLYVTGRDNLIHCFDLQRKRLAWSKSGGSLVSPVVVYNGQPVIASRDGVMGLRPRSGSPDWQIKGFEAGRGTPAIAGDRLYVAARNENLYCIDLAERKIVSSAEMDSAVESALTVADDTVYMGTGVGNIYAIDAATLAFRWYYRCSPTDTVGPAAKEEESTTGTNEGDRGGSSAGLPGGLSGGPGMAGGPGLPGAPGGQPEASTGVKTYGVNLPPTVANGAVYVVSEQGSLYCFRPDAFDVGKPRLHLPQLVTNAVDRSLVTFEMIDDELRELLVEEAEDNTPEGQEVKLPKNAETIKIPGIQPTMRFETYVYDEGSGIPLDKMVIKWNGQPHDSTLMRVTPNDYLLTVDLVPPGTGGTRTPLREGKHTIEITVPDWKGNVLVRTFTFEIDNSLPPIEPPTDETTTPGGPGGMPGLPGMPGMPGPGVAGGGALNE